MALERASAVDFDPLSALLADPEPPPARSEVAAAPSLFSRAIQAAALPFYEAVPPLPPPEEPHPSRATRGERAVPWEPPLPAEVWLDILHVDVHLLTGEQLCLECIAAGFEFNGVVITGFLSATNYRLLFAPSVDNLHELTPEQLLTAPRTIDHFRVALADISTIEKKGSMLQITCKVPRVLKFVFPAGDDSESFIDVLLRFVFAEDMSHLFAFEHRFPQIQRASKRRSYDAVAEFTRQGILESAINQSLNGAAPGAAIASPWRLTTANQNYALAPSYPSVLVVPRDMLTEDLFGAAAFRSEARLPVLVWGFMNSGKGGGTLWRSSQPKIGVGNKRSPSDDKLLCLLARASSASRLDVIDCRPLAAALANALTGHGTEAGAVHANMENIHGVARTYAELQKLVLSSSSSRDSDWGLAVEQTGWLTGIRLMLSAGLEAAQLVTARRSVLVHCSHGWDRLVVPRALFI
jgi:hypothetical protein